MPRFLNHAPMNKHIGPIEKIIRFLSGFLVSILVVAIFLKLFTDFFWATVAGTIVNGAAVYYILTKHPKNESLKMTAYGAVTGVLFIIIATALLWTAVDTAFRGLAD